MSRRLQLMPALAALVLVTACMPLRVTTMLDRGVTLTRYRAFEWDAMDARPTGDPRLDNNPFFHDYVRAAVERRLVRKGYVGATASGLAADFRLHYHASVAQRLQVDEPASPCTGNDCRASAIEFDEGTIVVDALDAGSGRVIWRGVARDSVQGLIDDQASMEREIDRLTTRMFEDFPPRPEASD